MQSFVKSSQDDVSFYTLDSTPECLYSVFNNNGYYILLFFKSALLGLGVFICFLEKEVDLLLNLKLIIRQNDIRESNKRMFKTC